MTVWLSHKEYADKYERYPVNCFGFLEWIDSEQPVGAVKCSECGIEYGVIRKREAGE